MNIQKNIDNATFYINKLKAGLPKINNANQRKFRIDMLNSFIVLINTIEFLMVNNKEIEALDQLLLGRIYSQMFQSVLDFEPIDIDLICRNIDQDLIYNKSVSVAKIVDLLQGHEVAMLSIEGNLSLENLKMIMPADEYSKMIKELLNQFKQQIVWN
tara:strand:- start:1316 stop:1786 length:471 start_codon:yes stop_codon:yes gene_type:complete